MSSTDTDTVLAKAFRKFCRNTPGALRIPACQRALEARKTAKNSNNTSTKSVVVREPV